MKGWIKKTIGELFDISGGLSASRAQLSDKGFPYLHYGDIHGSTMTFIDVSIDDSIPRLNLPLKKVSKVSLLEDGDVVFVDASEDDEGASRHIVVRNPNNTPFISGLHTIVAKAKTDELINKFREFCFQTSAVKAQFKFFASGTKVVGVNKSNIKDIAICFPKNKNEQCAIATALSDMDAYIEALEKLIAKKQLVKQGAMQELLTGKRRLPGFNGEWSEHIVEEISEAFAGGTPSTFEKSYWNGDIVWLQSGRCQNNVIKKHNNEICITARGLAESAAKLIKPNSVLVAITGATCGNIAFLPFTASANQSVVAIEPNDEIDSKFLYYLMLTKRDNILMLRTGSAQGGTNLKSIKSIGLLIPNKTEQTAIAEVLSDMDAEIDALTAKLNKAKHIKQGMMSELLTGRIRLTNIETK